MFFPLQGLYRAVQDFLHPPHVLAGQKFKVLGREGSDSGYSNGSFR